MRPLGVSAEPTSFAPDRSDAHSPLLSGRSHGLYGNHQVDSPYKALCSLLVQVTAGEARAAYTERDISSALAVAGLFAWPDRESEAWFKIDRIRAGCALPECLVALRRVLRDEAPHHLRAIISRVEPGAASLRFAGLMQRD